jgi:anaerobic magnesium-protoporphyrin IX monomethyl ester cyclase
MKILLINAPFPFEERPTAPLGLTSLAGYLLREGVDVRIEDCIVQPHSVERLRENLNTFRPDVVGATAVTMNVKAALRILGDYKEEQPGLITLMGGPHVTFDAEKILSENAFVDYIVRGEGEVTCTELLEALDSRASVENIVGISYRSNGAVVHNPDRPFIKDINVLPFPSVDLVPLTKYRAMGFPITMVTSRGCPHECIFCVGRRMVGRRVRYFDVKRVVDEFESLSRIGFSVICIVDDLFTANKARCMEVCDEILRRGISHLWSAFARVDTVSEELLGRMKAAGCMGLCFGIESGNQAILDRIKKKTTLEQCRRAAALCHEVGIDPWMSFILGLPGETAETVRETMEFGKILSESYGFHILAPFPGTEVRDRREDYGITILTDDWDRYDANQSVSATGSTAPEEIDRAVEGFNEEIFQFVERIRLKKEAGEPLTFREEGILKGQSDAQFGRNLILHGLVEHYPGTLNGMGREDVIEDFIEYLHSRIDSPREQIGEQVHRLMEAHCLEVKAVDPGTGIVWT